MLPPIRGVTPLIHVFDMSRSLEFYRDILGFAIVSTSSPGPEFYWAMLQLGEATLMLNTAYDDDQRPSAPDSARVAGHSDTVLYFACEDADQVYAHLGDKGWPAQEPVDTHYGMRQVYTKDPDGFELCFQHPSRVPETAQVGV